MTPGSSLAHRLDDREHGDLTAVEDVVPERDDRDLQAEVLLGVLVDPFVDSLE